MFNQLFGKFFKICLLLFLVLDIFSFWSYQDSGFNQIIFYLLTAAVLAVCLVKLEYGVYLMLGELFVGSQGHLLSLPLAGFYCSLRMVVFAAVMLAWLILVMQKKELVFFKQSNIFLYGYLGVLIFLAIGALNGVLNNSLLNVFSDGNGWLYLAAAPVIFTAIKSEKNISNVVGLLLAAGFYISCKTLIILVIFAYPFPFDISIFYRWLRDSRLGEITLVSGNFYRIFLQAQLYSLICFIFSFILYLFRSTLNLNDKTVRGLKWTAFVCSTVIIACLSRSFWFGLIMALAILLYFLKRKFSWSWKKLIRLFIMMMVVAALEVGFLFVLTNNLTAGWLKGRLNNPTEEAAGMSRLAQLGPLIKTLRPNWLLGAGFGKTVTYFSNDPRILAKSATGVYTTYAFEWGYLDIWLKIGLSGLLIYGWLYCQVFRRGAALAGKNITLAPVSLAVVIAITAICVTSIFSPYMNHPLGLGFLLIASAFINYIFLDHECKLN